MAQLSLSASHYLIYKSAFTYNLVSLSLLWRKLPASFQRWKWKVKVLSRVRLFATPWTVAYQAPQSMEFSRRVYWSGLLFPSPGNLSDPVLEPRSPTLQADALLSEPPGKPMQISAGKSPQIWLSISLTWPNNFFSDFSLWYFLLLDVIRNCLILPIEWKPHKHNSLSF